MKAITISLAPNGQFQMALPGREGDRFVPLAPGHELEILHRVLTAPAEDIGTSGAPTSSQVHHWEKHQIFPSDKCPFCVAEQHEKKDRKLVKELSKRFLDEGGTITGKVKTLNLDDLEIEIPML